MKPALLHFPNHALVEEEVLREYSSQFVFLNPRDTFEQEINLIGFYLLGGSYEFMIMDNLSPDYVLGKDGQKIELPEVVNGYRLYRKEFITNTVGIKFN